MGIFDNLYKWQKDQIKEIQDELTPAAKKLVDNLYEGQQEIVARAQSEAIDLAKKEYSKGVNTVYDKLVAIIKQKGFVGKLVGMFLEKYKDEVIGKLGV